MKMIHGVSPHPLFFEALFAHRRTVNAVFSEVQGLHEIAHIAITQVTAEQELLTFSATPALEFNLFKSPLWRYDSAYNPDWYAENRAALWSDLYHCTRFDELQYAKQIQYHYPLGLAMSTLIDHTRYLFSFASDKSDETTCHLFESQHQQFHDIAQYCLNQLRPLFNSLHATCSPHVAYPTGS